MADKKTYYAAARASIYADAQEGQVYVYAGQLNVDRAEATKLLMTAHDQGAYKLYKVTLEEVRTARVWDNLDDVPADAAVTDSDGDRIFRSGKRYAYESDAGCMHYISGPLFRSPFTEILED